MLERGVSDGQAGFHTGPSAAGGERGVIRGAGGTVDREAQGSGEDPR